MGQAHLFGKGRGMGATDQEIAVWLGRAGGESRADFSGLYDATAPLVFGVCLRLLGDRSEAEAALPDIYARIWREAPRASATGLPPVVWLKALVRDTCAQRLRAGRLDRSSRGVGDAEALEDLDLIPGTRHATVEAPEIVAGLAALEPTVARDLRRAYLEGATYPELAQGGGAPVVVVRARLRAGLSALRAGLSK